MKEREERMREKWQRYEEEVKLRETNPDLPPVQEEPDEPEIQVW